MSRVCSYCGCEAETAISRLMADHAAIADLVYRILRLVDGGDVNDAGVLAAELADLFLEHSLGEEEGLFAELRQAGEAVEETDRLVDDHKNLRAALSEAGLVLDGPRLRHVLSELVRHAEVEDSDLFPYAMQQLPDARWAELAAGPARSASSP